MWRSVGSVGVSRKCKYMRAAWGFWLVAASRSASSRQALVASVRSQPLAPSVDLRSASAELANGCPLLLNVGRLIEQAVHYLQPVESPRIPGRAIEPQRGTATIHDSSAGF